MSEPKLNLITTSAAELPDPFDLASLRLSQNFTESAGVKKLLRTVPVHSRMRKISSAFTLARRIAPTSRSLS